MKRKEEIQTIFEDDDIVVINKPAGMLSIPDRYNKEIENVFLELTNKYGKIFVVHRLDRDTSGIMVFAKNEDAHRILNTGFEKQKVTKNYHIVVRGIVPRDEIKIDIPIAPDPSKKGASIPSARGKESLTNLTVTERFRVGTLVNCELVTGRHHQLRVHCAAIGHPLLVDPLYGNNDSFYLSTIKRRYNLKKNKEERPIISRLTMHAYSLLFKHPATDKEMEFTAEYPKDFAALLQVLKKYSPIPDAYGSAFEF